MSEEYTQEGIVVKGYLPREYFGRAGLNAAGNSGEEYL